MKHLYLGAFLLLAATSLRAQDQLGFKYKFVAGDSFQRRFIAFPLAKRFRFNQGRQVNKDTLAGLFLLKDFPQKKTVIVAGTQKGAISYTIRAASPAPETARQLLPRRIYSKKLVGSIARKDGDTLFLSFRPIQANPYFDKKPDAVNAKNTRHKEEYLYIIANDQWVNPRLIYTQKARFRVPFAYTSLAATAIPLRLSLRKGSNGKAVSDFPTANLALFRVWGRELIYRAGPLEEARSRFFGLGPFVGPSLVMTTAAAGGEGRLGVVYGLNGVVGLGGVNFVLAVGGESSWSEHVETLSPWLGFGIGLKLVELSGGATSENKK